jgi:hypothetical protein
MPTFTTDPAREELRGDESVFCFALRRCETSRNCEAVPQTQVTWRILQRAAAGFSPTWLSAV